MREQQAFLGSYPAIDFYIEKDGEQPLAVLIETLFEYDFDFEGLKAARRDMPYCHYLRNQDIVRGTSIPAMMDLDSIPSPYLSGLCDKFLSSEFVPLVQTARGCPFECTYCQEGQEHFSGLRAWLRSVKCISCRQAVPAGDPRNAVSEGRLRSTKRSFQHASIIDEWAQRIADALNRMRPRRYD